MNKCKIIDEKNNYIPNLNNIYESAQRQFIEGNVFLEMAKDAINKFYNVDNPKLIYDVSNAIASNLAFACESFLKALYIFENNTKDNNIGTLWEKLKKPEKIISTRDKKKVKGHDLDILIENLSLDSKTLIETRLLTINSEKTKNYEEVTIYDILLKDKKIKRLNLLDENKYHSWLEDHKRTFEKSRYGGQLYHKVNLEFLFHLATQICAVAQYKIYPTKKQKKFKNFQNIEELPDEIITLFHLKNDLINEKLIDIISKDEEKKEEFIKIINNKPVLNMIIKDSKLYFHDIIKYFKYEELELIVNYLNDYNFEFNQKKKEIDKEKKKQGFIYPEELKRFKFIVIFQFFMLCLTAKKDYKIDITESTIIELTNIYLKKENKSSDENILKLAKKLND